MAFTKTRRSLSRYQKEIIRLTRLYETETGKSSSDPEAVAAWLYKHGHWKPQPERSPERILERDIKRTYNRDFLVNEYGEVIRL